MAKKLLLSIFICSFFFTSALAEAKEVKPEIQSQKKLYDPEMDCTKKAKLTWAQRKQLERIYNRIYNDYSDLIKTYSQAGVLTPYQTKVRFMMLNNYIKTFYKRNYQWCSEHESDEWEEEWYNSDND